MNIKGLAAIPASPALAVPFGLEIPPVGMNMPWDALLCTSHERPDQNRGVTINWSNPVQRRRARHSLLELFLEFCELLLQIGELPPYFLHLGCELGNALVGRVGIRK